MIRLSSYIFYSSIFVCNIIRIDGEYWNGNEIQTRIIFQMESMPPWITHDGSGMTDTDSTMNPTTISTTTPSSTFHFKDCNDTSSIWWSYNDTCIPKNDSRQSAVDIIRSSSSDSDEKASALILYFQTTEELTTLSNVSNTLTPAEIDRLVDNLNDIQTKNFSNFFFASQSTSNGIIGFASNKNLSNEIVQNITKTKVTDSTISAAILVNDQSINNVSNVKAFILGEPIAYRTIDPSNKQDIVSSVIIGSVNRKYKESIIDVTLYFQVLYKDQSHDDDGRYLCVFLDTNTSTWNETGCSKPVYNETFDRYECTCNHLTTFALIWLPSDILQSRNFTAQDIASLVFLSISILCFIAVIIHSSYTRLRNPLISLLPRDLLPLISSASTTILFIFYIALTMTVYTRISSSSSSFEVSTPCFTSASVLMFFVYFFLIFMFCAKTSIGYFNYLRFVRLFPEPSYKKLFFLLLISFFISIACTLLAVGLNSNPSFHITQLYGNKLCWFTRDVIYYFMAIPIGIFFLLNSITIILVAKRIIRHVRYSTSRNDHHKRMKQCVLVLLSSCLTQGIGWIFGPFITFVDPQTANILGWIFIIFDGLEGLWTILLYIIIRSQHMDESRQVSDDRIDRQKLKKKESYDFNSILEWPSRNTHRDEQNKNINFYDLYEEKSIDWDGTIDEL